ncbi:MAG: dimethylsulfoniopropionate demethylase [Pseudomonadota bacterium]
MAVLARARRIRETPFTTRVLAAGVSAWSVYNRMLLPAAFGAVEDDYRHLKTAVQIWDVSVERQVELRGPDAARLVQMLTPRDLSRLKPGRCLYAPVVDPAGGMLNDPVILQLAPDRLWLSVADGDVMLWAKGLAHGAGLDVAVSEPDINPVAVQGPLADDLMARVFTAAPGLKFFGWDWFDFGAQRVIVARSGYSKQGGFEIYCPGPLGPALWDALIEAGRGLDVRVGCPNLIERIEGGLLSYGNDMTPDDTPFDCGLGRYCDGAACVGAAALASADPPVRQIRSLAVGGPAVPPCTAPWPLMAGDVRVGQVTSIAFSPDFGVNVALGMVAASHWAAGTALTVSAPDQPRPAEVRAGSFL